MISFIPFLIPKVLQYSKLLPTKYSKSLPVYSHEHLLWNIYHYLKPFNASCVCMWCVLTFCPKSVNRRVHLTLFLSVVCVEISMSDFVCIVVMVFKLYNVCIAEGQAIEVCIVVVIQPIYDNVCTVDSHTIDICHCGEHSEIIKEFFSVIEKRLPTQWCMGKWKYIWFARTFILKIFDGIVTTSME